jgi:hypothetical protein
MVKYPRLAAHEFGPHCLHQRLVNLNRLINHPDGGDRTLLDNWFAFWSGRLYLKSTGTVQWFNRKDLFVPRLRDAVKSMHFISKDAWDVLVERAPLQSLVKDHSVPVKVLRREIKAAAFNTVEQLEHFLCERYRLGVITATEHTRLNKEGLGAEMPSNDHSEYARYSRVNIERSAEHLAWLTSRLPRQ